RTWADADVRVQICRCRHERWFVWPTATDGANRALRSDKAISVTRGVLREPLLQAANDGCRVDNRISIRHQVPNTGVTQPTVYTHPKPRQSDLFPCHRVPR